MPLRQESREQSPGQQARGREEKCDQRRVLRRICFLKIEDADLMRRTVPGTANPGFTGFGDFQGIVGNVRMHNSRFFGDGLVVVASGMMQVRERTQQERREHSEAPLNGYKALHFLGFPLTLTVQNGRQLPCSISSLRATVKHDRLSRLVSPFRLRGTQTKTAKGHAKSRIVRVRFTEDGLEAVARKAKATINRLTLDQEHDSFCFALRTVATSRTVLA